MRRWTSLIRPCLRLRGRRRRRPPRGCRCPSLGGPFPSGLRSCSRSSPYWLWEVPSSFCCCTGCCTRSPLRRSPGSAPAGSIPVCRPDRDGIYSRTRRLPPAAGASWPIVMTRALPGQLPAGDGPADAVRNDRARSRPSGQWREPREVGSNGDQPNGRRNADEQI